MKLAFPEWNNKASCPHCQSSSTVVAILKHHQCPVLGNEVHHRIIPAVYWIRLRHHTDPYTEGYIGQTKNLSNRLKGHEHYHPSNPDLVVEILHEEPNRNRRLELEEHYRPHPDIAWNRHRGGH